MAKHEIIKAIESFSLNEGTLTWESNYAFQPSPLLMTYLSTVPEGQAIYFYTKSALPDMEYCMVVKDTPGFRLQILDHSVYLHIGFMDQTSMDACLSMHAELLSYQFYYPYEKDLLAYWEDPTDDYNNAADYFNQTTRSSYLGRIIQDHCPHDPKKVLEIGCNVGRNLAFLKDRKFEVSGIEINAQAITLLRAHYPQLSESHIYNGEAKATLKTLSDNSFDIVFSMAVLMHIHPTAEDTFWQDIIRVTNKYLITIENEVCSSNRNWARDYGYIFESCGARCIFAEKTEIGDPALNGYVTRVFDCSGC